MRGATSCATILIGYMLFQSTLLMRGATHADDPTMPPAGISIHAPHARSDDRQFVGRAGGQHISIHAPHARSDTFNNKLYQLEGISIHAPHARSDHLQAHLLRLWAVHFNPRSSCEERPGAGGDGLMIEVFQSTLLMRGATRRRSCVCE